MSLKNGSTYIYRRPCLIGFAIQNSGPALRPSCHHGTCLIRQVCDVVPKYSTATLQKKRLGFKGAFFSIKDPGSSPLIGCAGTTHISHSTSDVHAKFHSISRVVQNSKLCWLRQARTPSWRRCRHLSVSPESNILSTISIAHLQPKKSIFLLTEFDLEKKLGT